MKKIALLATMVLAALSIVSGVRAGTPCPLIAITDVPPPDCAPDCMSLN